MSNINQIIRYKTIDRCMRRRGYQYNWEGLAKACAEAYNENGITAKEPSRRTIMGDIEKMRSGILGYEAPILYNKAENAFFYSDSNFSISGNPLNARDLTELQSALTILKQFNGMQLDGIEQIITKIEDTLSTRGQSKTTSVIQFETVPDLKGLELLPELHYLTLRKNVLRITYQPYSKEGYLVVLSPYLLKQYNQRWFLIGYNHKERKVQNLALDRIQEIDKELIERYIAVPQFNKDLYFKSIVGVSLKEGAPVEEVVIETTSLQAKYIKTKPIHSSQKLIEEDEEKSVFSLQLIPNFELESRILSFGENIRVTAPKSLVERMKERIMRMSEKQK